MNTIRKLPLRAFTLIELLVIIAIIVILASMLVPCLAKAKAKALQASCLCNQKQFSAAFTMYVNDNASKLPSLAVRNGFSNVAGYWQIRNATSQTWLSSQAAMTEVQTGLLTNSVLFAYFPSVAVNHCPGDPRLNNPLGTNTLARGWAYDSYALTQNIVGGGLGMLGFIRLTDIRRVSDCMIVTERADSRGCNLAPFQASAGGGGYAGKEILNLFGIYHGKVGTFSFADGHVEGHKWTDPNILQSGLAANQPGVTAYFYGQPSTPRPSPTGLDFAWVFQHWVNWQDP